MDIPNKTNDPIAYYTGLGKFVVGVELDRISGLSSWRVFCITEALHGRLREEAIFYFQALQATDRPHRSNFEILSSSTPPTNFYRPTV